MNTVDNGRTASADFPFYKGVVGVSERDGRTEIAYFGVAPGRPLPIDGKLDGERFRVVSVHARDLSQATTTYGRADTVRVVTLTVIPR